MAMSNTELIEKIKAKEAQLKAKRQKIENREKEKARKERTRLLIQTGALVEKYFNLENIALDDRENIFKKIVEKPILKSVIDSALPPVDPDPEQPQETAAASSEKLSSDAG